MAHLHSFVADESANYVDGKKSSSQIKYPDTGFFKGFNKPIQFEGNIFDLEVSGTIPDDINGTFC
jgi:hypothetical protein